MARARRRFIILAVVLIAFVVILLVVFGADGISIRDGERITKGMTKREVVAILKCTQIPNELPSSMTVHVIPASDGFIYLGFDKAGLVEYVEIKPASRLGVWRQQFRWATGW
jgi:hypothetical protein